MASVFKCYWRGQKQPASGKSAAGSSATVSGGSRSSAVADAVVTSVDTGTVVSLSEAESRHLVKVFRARVGDTIILFNAQGQAWRSTLVQADGRAAQVRIEGSETVEAPRPRITLGQAMPKGKNDGQCDFRDG